MTVKFFADIRELAGGDETQWDQPADTVGGLLKGMAARYGPAFQRRLFDDGQLSPTIIVIVNGQDIRHLAGAATPLHSNDTVDIFPMVAGG